MRSPLVASAENAGPVSKIRSCPASAHAPPAPAPSGTATFASPGAGGQRPAAAGPMAPAPPAGRRATGQQRLQAAEVASTASAGRWRHPAARLARAGIGQPAHRHHRQRGPMGQVGEHLQRKHR